LELKISDQLNRSYDEKYCAYTLHTENKDDDRYKLTTTTHP